MFHTHDMTTADLTATNLTAIMTDVTDDLAAVDVSDDAPTAASDSAPTAASDSAQPNATQEELFEEAKQLLSDEAGILEFRNLMLTMGLHATRSTFRNIMNEYLPSSAEQLAAIEQRIKDISPITEIGCMQVDFFNKLRNKQDRVYLVLDSCKKNHNLTAELDKIKLCVSDEKWADVLKSLANLVFFGRTVYANESRKHITIIQDIVGCDTPPEILSNFLNFKVDPVNTTLYLDENWPERIGIFVRREE